MYTRLEKLQTLKDEVRKYQEMVKQNLEKEYNLKTIRKLYHDLVKMSSRVKVAISGLGEIEKAMNRPFVFSGVRYDEDHMFYQMKRLRLKVLKQIPKL